MVDRKFETFERFWALRIIRTVHEEIGVEAYWWAPYMRSRIRRDGYRHDRAIATLGATNKAAGKGRRKHL